MASISAVSSSSSSLLHVFPLAFAFPLRRPPPTSLAVPVIRRPPVPSRSRPRTLKCFSQKQSVQEFERLFSNLNQATMKREPGSVTSGILLVAGTTVSMAMRTLGKFGVQAAWWESATFFSLVFGGICYFGSQRVIGAINGFLVLGIVVSFTSLVGVASGGLQWQSLLQAHFEAIPQSIPIIALSFVYQNVVPVLCTNLEGDLSKVRTAVVLGTAIPLVLFLIWNAVILGTIPNLDTTGALTDPLQQLRSENGIVGPIVEVFSFFAIATSYIGFVLGLSDFVSDLLKLPSGQSKPLPYLLTLLPPLVLSLLDPEIFFKALDFAGTYGVLVLFGVIPAAMSWSERYSKSSLTPITPPLVPGGRSTLIIVTGGALFVIFSEILKDVMHQ
ncbi:Tryptophan/tyrosine permease family [Musa troglodytarum]|uniref:Tryptophan/tyrosine permease family n=1 Tax=Musa troglodytarum TaxID=320322 RepID=A0A9E7KML1_9LILI|nr:Tryptophan/tyrosine permease family [Musa troglodytarum]